MYITNANSWKQMSQYLESETSLDLARFLLSDKMCEPWLEEIRMRVLAFYVTVYSNAYSMDNLTCMLYVKRLVQLQKANHLVPSDMTLKEFLAKMSKSLPKGFGKCFVKGHVLFISDETRLTINKAYRFLEYVKSGQFIEMIVPYLIDNKQHNMS